MSCFEGNALHASILTREYVRATVPTIDESRPGRASELIKRFQAQVDANTNTNAAPAVVSAPRMARTSSGGNQSSSRSTTPSIASANENVSTPASTATSAPDVNPPQQAADSTSPDTADKADPLRLNNKNIEEQVHLRSAGLDAPPPSQDQTKRQSAREAFPDMQDAPTEATILALDEEKSSDLQPAKVDKDEAAGGTEEGTATTL